MGENKQFYPRAEPTGKTVAVVGAGPAGLRARLQDGHVMAVAGEPVRGGKAGGLNEYGIAAYKSVDDFAQAEVDYVTAIGGIDIQNGKALGRDYQLSDLIRNYDAVFLGMGLGGVNALRADGEDADGVINAVEFIAELRQASDLSGLPVGRRVVVIGGGMTAIDAAVQSKLLGAEEVTICYRRGQEHMNASEFEQDLAAANGVSIRHWLQPKRVIAESGKVTAVELEYTALNGDRLAGTGETLTLVADQVFKAIGQSFVPAALNGSGASIGLEAGRIKVDSEGRTSLAKVWAGGDCIFGGDDLTVSAVAQGRDAAESINRALTSNGRA
ncbi:FAD-dependent oxidoreductase [Mesorhizobium sp. M7A.F.Ca.CA.002.09.1.1]|uniref:FAD-dependent oxidoreductase n=1 Tax=Mesorhizobium sp. M7A.F.Ca.CA.002.09.1.1 TaxID=2496739 RepID=UPI0032AEB343